MQRGRMDSAHWAARKACAPSVRTRRRVTLRSFRERLARSGAIAAAKAAPGTRATPSGSAPTNSVSPATPRPAHRRRTTCDRHRERPGSPPDAQRRERRIFQHLSLREQHGFRSCRWPSPLVMLVRLPSRCGAESVSRGARTVGDVLGEGAGSSSCQASPGREADPLHRSCPRSCCRSCWSLSGSLALLWRAVLAAQLASRLSASCEGDPGSAV